MYTHDDHDPEESALDLMAKESKKRLSVGNSIPHKCHVLYILYCVNISTASTASRLVYASRQFSCILIVLS